MGWGCGKVGSLMRTEGRSPYNHAHWPGWQWLWGPCYRGARRAKPSCTHHLTQESKMGTPRIEGLSCVVCCSPEPSPVPDRGQGFQDYFVIPIPALFLCMYSDCPLPLTLTSTPFILLKSFQSFLSDHLPNPPVLHSPHASWPLGLTYTIDHLLTDSSLYSHSALLLPLSVLRPASLMFARGLSWNLHALGQSICFS